MRAISTTILAYAMTAALAACGGGSSNGPDGKYELYIDSDYLDTLQLTFLKGRCVARMAIDSKDATAETALLGFGRHVAGDIPLDGSAPADDDELTALVPVPPLGGELADWEDDGGEVWLVTTDAFDWINGSGPPFQDNGFEAVAGDSYTHATESWDLDLEIVNMGDPVGAEAGFRAASWDSGTQHD